jgi:site-specific DNA-methyltransferase (adenine-specific)
MDCLQLLKSRTNASIDLIYIDPPFGTTEQPWDTKLPWETIFEECFRVLKPAGTLVIHCSIPFNYTLIRAAPKPPSYSWYWNKQQVTCPLLANKQPLRCMEEILVWKNKRITYNRQQIGDEERESHWMTPTDYYRPVQPRQKTILKGKTRTHYLDIPRALHKFSTRPEEMVELMIKSYSNEGDVVMDFTCHMGLSGQVCKRLNRKWIGGDLYYVPQWLFQSTK